MADLAFFFAVLAVVLSGRHENRVLEAAEIDEAHSNSKEDGSNDQPQDCQRDFSAYLVEHNGRENFVDLAKRVIDRPLDPLVFFLG